MQLQKKSGLPALISKEKFIRDTLALAGGTVVAQAIAILVSPVLTRLYLPTDFGIFAVFSSAFAILVPVASGRYTLAIMLPQKDGDAFKMVQLSALIALVFCLILLFCLPLMHDRISMLGLDLDAGAWSPLLPPAVLIGSLYQAFALWGSRKKKFKFVGLAKIIQVIAMVFIQILCAFVGVGTLGLIWGHVIGYLTGMISMTVLTIDRKVLSVSCAGAKTLKSLAIRYKEFPLYMTWGGMMDSLSIHLTPILLTVYFTPAEVGFYALSYRIITVPISLLGRSMSNVLFQRIAEKRSVGENISTLVEKILSKMVLISFLVAMLLLVGGPSLFGLIFGVKWTAAGTFTRILAPMFFIQFIIAPVTPLLIVLEKQQILTLIQGFLLTGTIVPIVVGGTITHDVYETMMFFSAAQTIIYIFYLAVIIKVSRASLRNITNNLFIFTYSTSGHSQ